MNLSLKSSAQIKIGLFADCQYCDCDPVGNRFYRNAIQKLTFCISEFNKNDNIDFIVGLGDLIDRDFSSFEKVNSVLSNSQKNVFHVTGNHDFAVETKSIDLVPSQLDLLKTYYSIEKKDWKFIFLDGNEITLQSTNKKTLKQAEKLLNSLTKKGKPNNQEWNGGMGKKQINWMEKQLNAATKKNQNVVIFCHYPLQPMGVHCLWNSEEVLTSLKKFKCVKAWINGHNHSGDYIEREGIHFITLKGMVDTEHENAFSILSLSTNRIEFSGFGREKSLSLLVK